MVCKCFTLARLEAFFGRSARRLVGGKVWAREIICGLGQTYKWCASVLLLHASKPSSADQHGGWLVAVGWGNNLRFWDRHTSKMCARYSAERSTEEGDDIKRTRLNVANATMHSARILIQLF